MLKYNNKYNAKKTTYKGKRYDSKKEAEYAKILDQLLKEKKILSWNRQKRFKLPDLNWLETKSMRSWYAVDFVVITEDKREHLLEIKGVLTPENKIKYAFFKYVYRRPLHIIRTTGLEKMNTNWLSCKECKKDNEKTKDI